MEDNYWRPKVIAWNEQAQEVMELCDSGQIPLSEGYRRLGAIFEDVDWMLKVGSQE